MPPSIWGYTDPHLRGTGLACGCGTRGISGSFGCRGHAARSILVLAGHGSTWIDGSAEVEVSQAPHPASSPRMRLRVFGRNTDDKGSQLEELTRRLLERLGYRQLALNVVGSGGSEVDVRGEYPVPGPVGSAAVRVVGECKAYETPVNLPDWLKFLGKIYSEEARSPGEVRGLFVALSGANGNVRGAVDELRVHKRTIDFVDGENLVPLVQEEFATPPLARVAQRASELAPDPVAEFSLGYFNRQAFWTLQFANGTFSILLGKNLDETPTPDLAGIVADQLQAAKYRDLYQEEEHRRRLRDTRKVILSRLLSDRQWRTCAALSAKEGEFTPSASDVSAALAEMVDSGLVEKKGAEYSINNIVEQPDARVSILRELTDETLFLSGVCTPGWLSVLDEKLLDSILEIQGNLQIPQHLRDEALSLLRWSPTGLAWSIRPDQVLVAHRRTPEEQRKSDADDARYFRVQLLRYAISDFMTGPFAQVYFERLDLREVEFLRRAKFKSSSKLELEVEVTERFATARTTAELGGGVVRIWVHEATPDPWDWGKDGQRQAAGAAGDEADAG